MSLGYEVRVVDGKLALLEGFDVGVAQCTVVKLKWTNERSKTKDDASEFRGTIERIDGAEFREFEAFFFATFEIEDVDLRCDVFEIEEIELIANESGVFEAVFGFGDELLCFFCCGVVAQEFSIGTLLIRDEDGFAVVAVDVVTIDVKASEYGLQLVRCVHFVRSVCCEIESIYFAAIGAFGCFKIGVIFVLIGEENVIAARMVRIFVDELVFVLSRAQFVVVDLLIFIDRGEGRGIRLGLLIRGIIKAIALPRGVRVFDPVDFVV